MQLLVAAFDQEPQPTSSMMHAGLSLPKLLAFLSCSAPGFDHWLETQAEMRSAEHDIAATTQTIPYKLSTTRAMGAATKN